MARTQYIYGKNGSIRRLSNLLHEAATRQVRWAHFGDSQETSPGGNGTKYMNHLNFELLNRFTGGVTTESLVQECKSEVGHWLARGGKANDTPTDLLEANEILPGWGVFSAGLGRDSMREVGRIQPTSSSGFIHLLDYNASVAQGDIDARSYIDNTATFNYEVWTIQQPGLPDLAYRFYGHDTSDADYGVSATVLTASGTSGTGGITKIVLEDISIADPVTNPYLTMVTGSSTTTEVPILGGRFISQTNVGGISVQSFGVGGYHTDDLLDNHANSGPMLAAFGPWDIIGFQTGANDVYGVDEKSATEIMTDLQANIAAVRSWVGNDPLVVLITEAPRINGTTDENTQADALQVALRDYAASNNGIVTLDARAVVANLNVPWTREAEQARWDINDDETDTIYLDSSSVHYKDAGHIAYAQAVAQCLERAHADAYTLASYGMPRITP